MKKVVNDFFNSREPIDVLTLGSNNQASGAAGNGAGPAGSASPAEKSPHIGKSTATFDAQLAASCQATEDRLVDERAAMMSTLHGKAYKFTEMVLNKCRRIEKQPSRQGLDI